MSSSFETISPSYRYLHPPPYETLNTLSCRSQDSFLPRRSRSPSFLDSVKGLVRRSRSPLRLRTSNGDAFNTPQAQESFNTAPQARPVPDNGARSSRSSAQKRRERRENIPSMIDYLTLSQLENVWQRQDTYKGCVDAPQRAPQQSAMFISQPSEENLEIPYIDVHPTQRRYHLHGKLARQRRAAASASTDRWRQ